MKLHRTNLSFEHLTRAHSKQAIKFYDYESFENLDDPEEKKKKWRILISVLFSLCMIQTLFLNVASFLPTFVEKHHSNISTFLVGVVLRWVYFYILILVWGSMFELAGLTCSALIGASLHRVGRKNSIIIGYIIMVTWMYIICYRFHRQLLLEQFHSFRMTIYLYHLQLY